MGEIPLEIKITKKIAVIAFLIPISGLAIAFAFNAFIYNPATELPISAKLLEQKDGSNNTIFVLDYGVGYKAPDFRKTLYNCKLEIKYLAINGTWLTITENLGDQDFSAYKNWTVTLPDFDLDPNRFHYENIWPVETQRIELKAYGYLKP